MNRIVRLFLALLIAGTFGPTAADAQETLMEKLGYERDDVLLIIHADDMGMSHSANQACIEALDKGIVTAASVMVPCPWFLEAADYATSTPDADMGLHLTFTSEWKHYRWGPIAPKSEVPGLIDPQGYLFHGVREVYQSASAEEIEREMRAQIDHAIKNGLHPTHLDSHMGTLYYNPEYLNTALRVAEEYDIPFMYFNSTPKMFSRIRENVREQFVELSNRLKQRGWPLIDSLPRIDDTPVEQMDKAYRELIAGLEPGVHLLIIHPNKLTPESRAITGTHKQRDKEYRLFTDPAMGRFIKEQGVHLIGWDDLKPVWNQRQKP